MRNGLARTASARNRPVMHDVAGKYVPDHALPHDRVRRARDSDSSRILRVRFSFVSRVPAM